MFSKKLLSLALVLLSKLLNAQEPVSPDTTENHHIYLPDVTVVGRYSKSDIQQMPEIVGTSIYAGKKNALIVMDNVNGNVVMNSMRQVLSKVSGIHIWESDPSGIQIGIAARGLSPNRSWEFNVRQNGYDIAADPFGYPEAYYNPQLQAVQRIEIVRGQGSLQYGPQFGGMVNYILRNGSEIKGDKKIEFESQQTTGSNALFNSYNAIGGKTEKIHYYSFFDHRNGNGWRENSRYFTNAGFGTLTYFLSPGTSITAELMHSHIRSQQAGGLTDSLFNINPKQSFRNRNWFDITWTTPAVILNHQFSEQSKWNTKFFATIGNRNSVGFLQPVTVTDSLSARTLQADKYRNYGMESRLLTRYGSGKQRHHFSAGIRLYTGTTWRKADGKGTPGSDYDMTITSAYKKDIRFTSLNAAAFVENIFRLGERFIIIPGIRYEWLKATADVSRSRGFLLAGVGTEYHISSTTELYANISQAYRPIQFANLQAPPTTDVIDPALKDAKGYNADLGYRGKVKEYLRFDLSVFYLQYNNRIGTITVNAPSTYRLITNVGNSSSKGIEAFAEFNAARVLTTDRKLDVLLFGSYGYTDARYSSDHKDASTKGKKVENAPANIFRGGLSAGYKGGSICLQLSHVSETFSDANNTFLPSPNAQNGLIPSYTVMDITAGFKFSSRLNFKSGINNLTGVKYFTRRAGGYPGPGLLPADGRTFFISAGFKL